MNFHLKRGGRAIGGGSDEENASTWEYGMEERS